MATAYVGTNLFGLTVLAEPGHPAIALIRRLPRDLWIGPLTGTGEREFIVALTPEVLPLMRRLFKMKGLEFSEEAVTALAALSGRTRSAAPSRGAKDTAAESAPRTPAQSRSRVIVAPEVSASLRSLPPTLDPFVNERGGTSIPPTTGVNLSDGAPQ